MLRLQRSRETQGRAAASIEGSLCPRRPGSVREPVSANGRVASRSGCGLRGSRLWTLSRCSVLVARYSLLVTRYLSQPAGKNVGTTRLLFQPGQSSGGFLHLAILLVPLRHCLLDFPGDGVALGQLAAIVEIDLHGVDLAVERLYCRLAAFELPSYFGQRLSPPGFVFHRLLFGRILRRYLGTRLDRLGWLGPDGWRSGLSDLAGRGRRRGTASKALQVVVGIDLSRRLD